ncbi:hypothetical protein TIFTF001_022932 [Ficus carica]|uniref:Uncharacterized protein n=1 Tax=Ficus carica TaxID=3494 RepID=A0AA88AFA8_FICCA|nr:hypothetical protein TIFTF001_022932 [Ficus carica]
MCCWRYRELRQEVKHPNNQCSFVGGTIRVKGASSLGQRFSAIGDVAGSHSLLELSWPEMLSERCTSVGEPSDLERAEEDLMATKFFKKFSLEVFHLEVLVGGFSDHGFLLFSGMTTSGGGRTLPLTI